MLGEEIPKLEELKSQAIDGKPEDPNDFSLHQLIRLIRLERTNGLRKQKEDELKKLSKGQGEVGFLNNLRRILTIGAKEDGSFEVTEELQKVIAKAAEPGSEHLKELLNNCGITDETKSLTKQEKDNVIDSIRLLVEQKHSLNDMSIQTLAKLESEMDQTYQYLMTSLKTDHDTKRTITRGMRPGG